MKTDFELMCEIIKHMAKKHNTGLGQAKQMGLDLKYLRYSPNHTKITFKGMWYMFNERKNASTSI